MNVKHHFASRDEGGFDGELISKFLVVLHVITLGGSLLLLAVALYQELAKSKR